MSRSGLTLLVAAVVLAALALLLANPFRDSVRVDNPESQGLFDGGAVLDADGVRIAAPGAEEVVLARGPEGWTVASRDGFPADTAAVGSILRATAAALTTGPVSTNPENRAKFQVDSTGVSVRVSRAGEEVAAFTVGKSGRDFTTSYVRPGGDEAVHLVRGLNRNLFTRPQGFRDAAILRFDPARVAAVTWSGSGGEWTLARTDSMWTRARAGGEVEPASAAAADELLRALGRFDADGFADEAPDTLDTGLEPPETVVTVRFEDGAAEELRIGRDNGRNQRYVARPGRRVVYVVGQWRVDRVVRDYEGLAG